jgi:uncharacterized protein (DUF58 family)
MAHDVVTLGTRSIYILPTRHGLVFTLVLLALLIAAVNYANALAYLLTFLLIGMAIVSTLHTQRNLLGLEITATGGDPVFAGEVAHFRLCVRNAGPARRALLVDTGHPPRTVFDVPARDTRCVSLAAPAARRGWLECPPLILATDYPLGIMHAWTRRLRLPARCLVYPQPAERDGPRGWPAEGGEGGSGPLRDSEDFASLRAYQPGDPLAHISWKTLARGQGLYTKDFRAPGAPSVWLDWEAFAPHATEPRLSLLTRAVLDADEAGVRYGLRLPNAALAPANGPQHRAACLEALALYDAPGQG